MTDLALGPKLSDAGRADANTAIAALQIPGGVHRDSRFSQSRPPPRGAETRPTASVPGNPTTARTTVRAGSFTIRSDDPAGGPGAAIATALLIHHFTKHLEPNAAFGLAAFAFIEGSKTAR